MIRKPRILVIGSFMMDLIVSAPRVPELGETVIGTSFSTAPGGKGANQAVQCALLGADVVMVGCVGRDAFGQELLDAAAAAGVDVSQVKISDNSRSGVGNIQLQINENGVQNRIVVTPGANYDLKMSDLGWLEQRISSFDLVMLQLELAMEVTEYAANLAAKASVPVMLNPAPAAPLSKDLLRHITYLSPNEHEAALLSGLTLRTTETGVDQKDLAAIASALHDMGVNKVMITLGDNGSALMDSKGLTRANCVTMPEVRDPTAAGDSFVAAFCTALCAGLSERQAMVFASHAAAITVSRLGAMPSLPRLSEVQALLLERDCQSFDPRILDDLR